MDSKTKTNEASATVKGDPEFAKMPAKESSDDVSEGCQASKMMKSLSPSKRRDLEFSAQQMDGLDLTVRGLSGNLPAPKTSDVSSDVKDPITDSANGETKISGKQLMVDQSNKSLESKSTPKKSAEIVRPEVELESPYRNIGLTPHLKDLEKERLEETKKLAESQSRDQEMNRVEGSIKSPEENAINDWNLIPISPYTIRSYIVDYKRKKSKSQIKHTEGMKKSQVLLFDALSDIKSLSMLIGVVNLSFTYGETALVCRMINADALSSYYRGYRVMIGNVIRQFKEVCQEMESQLDEMSRRMKTGDFLVVQRGHDVYGMPNPPRDDLYPFYEKLMHQLKTSQNHIGSACNLLSLIHPKLQILVDLDKEMRQLINDFLEEDFPHLFIGGHV